MDFTQAKQGGIMVKQVHLSRATKDQAEAFKKFLVKDINEKNNKIVVDLSECEFIDSTFISTLVIALKSINKIKGALKLVAVHTDVLAILELTGLVKVFDVFKSVKEAIGSIA